MAGDTPHESLSRREREILALLSEKLSDRQIAERLYVAVPTVKWYNRQIFNKLGVDSRRQAVERAAELSLDGTDEDAPAETPAHSNLPAQLTPFIGRSVELTEIGKLLMQPGARLITVLAPGGMGKTRLALETAEGLMPHFADGVYVVALAPLNSSDELIPAVAEALDVPFAPDGRTQQKQIEDYLRGKATLLMLDNFEHLLDAVPTVAELLAAAPKVKVLATSRERLNLLGETVYPLGGLQYPEADADDPLRYGASQLFIESALRANPHFEVSDPGTIGQLCRRVQGMPLAIELAAAWTGALSVAEIEAEVAKSADFLETTMANVPERQRSVRAVFEAAWTRLDERSRQAFRRMSVFRGGCTRDAAQAVTGADARTLIGLVDKALLWRDPRAGRYDIHELLRQYAEAELEQAGEREAVLQTHQTYFAGEADQASRWLRSGRQLDGFAVLDADIENIRRAFTRASGRGIPDEIELFAELYVYYETRGLWVEFHTSYSAAAEGLKETASPTLGRILSGLAYYYQRMSMNEQMAEAAQRSVAILRPHGAGGALAIAMIQQSHSLFRRKQRDDSQRLALEALSIARTSGDRRAIAQALATSGSYLSERAEGDTPLYEAVRLLAEVDDYWAMCPPLLSLGWNAIAESRLDDAAEHFQQTLEAARKIRYNFVIQGAEFCNLIVLKERGDWEPLHQAASTLMTQRRQQGILDYQVMLIKLLLAQSTTMLGDLDAARDFLRETLAATETLEVSGSLSWWSIVAAAYLIRTGDFARATSVLGHAQNSETGHFLSPMDQQAFAASLERCTAELPGTEFDAAWTHGQSLTYKEALELVKAGV